MDQEGDQIWPSNEERISAQYELAKTLGALLERLPGGAVTQSIDAEEIRAAIDAIDFNGPNNALTAARRVVELLEWGMVHMMHPGYMGLFNPTVVFPGILADQITAHLNPQLAVWSHAPVPIEMERRVIKEIAGFFDFSPEVACGHFTSGGAEANATAVLMALTRANEDFARTGVLAFGGTPTIYASVESHQAWFKIAHHSGIGRGAVRLVRTDGRGCLDLGDLRRLIGCDRASGRKPVLIAATAGTTNAGMIDPLTGCAAIAREQGLWFHVDAAWGGAIALLPEQAGVLTGIEHADSITLDAHKWFAAPMGAGMLLAKDNKLLGDVFRVSAGYMPDGAADLDPYTHSVQWSRRFIGLKLFLSLASIGWDGYRALFRQTLELSSELRYRLTKERWKVVNDSPVAVICFIDEEQELNLPGIAASVVVDGRAWISAAQYEGRPVLRACITSHRTGDKQLGDLIAALDSARRSQCQQH